MVGSVVARTLFAVALCAAAGAQQAAERSRPWPPGTADLPADPALHFGVLDNGLRFVWRHHPRPPGRCSLRLVVHVGSLDEADDERGMAHFVEHMAFNGTRRFPGNSIGDWFRSRGMRVGLHANAITSAVDTTYCVDLPGHDVAAIQDGLDVLRQFADGVLFAPDEVAAEMGVVDAEQRERGSAAGLAEETVRHRLLAGTRYPERPPIGVAAERAAFTPARLRAFHARWYRPDNMTLVLVGDLEERDVAQLCRSTLGQLAPSADPLPERAPVGIPDLRDTSFAVDEPGRSDVLWRVQRLTAHPARQPAPAGQGDVVLGEAAAEMARWLLAEALDVPGSPVQALSVATVAWARELDACTVHFRSDPERAAAALRECARAIHALHASEFSAELLERVRRQEIAADDMVLAAAERTAGATRADWLAARLAAGAVPTELRALIEARRRAWLDLTAEQCAAHWFATWNRDLPSICTVGPPGHGVDTAAIWNEIAAQAPQPDLPLPPLPGDAVDRLLDADPGTERMPSWPYASDHIADPAPVMQRHRDDTLALEELWFANQVHVVIKPTRLAPDAVRVLACIGAGHHLLGDDERQAARLFELMAPGGGLRRIGSGDLRRLTSGRPVWVSVPGDVDRFVVAGGCDGGSLPFLLEWMLAQVTEPGFEPAEYRRITESQRSRFGSSSGSAGALMLDFASRFCGRPVGFMPERVARVELGAVRRLFAARWRDQPITLVVVGDVDLEAAIAAVGRTFGRLPPRRSPEELAVTVPYLAAPNVLHEEHALPAGQTSSFVELYVPLPDLRWLERGEAVGLARVLQGRLRARLREAMAATYECRTEVEELMTEARCILLKATVRVAPGREQEVRAAMQHELGAMAADGVTEAEAEGLRAQRRNERRENGQDNDYWVWRLSRVHGEPAMLREWTATLDAYEAISADRLSQLAAAWFAPERVSSLVLRAPSAK